MRKLVILLLVLLFSVTSYGQWKSYYPQQSSSNKYNEKVDSEKSKKLFENYLFNALKAKSLEDYDEALKYFEKCIKINAKNPLAFYESAIINSANGRYSIAEEQIKVAVKLDPKNRWYSILYAEILFTKEDFVNAAKLYKRLIALEPRNENLYFKLSETYFYTNDLRKAIAVYDDLQQYKGFDKILSMQKHKLYRELNDIKGAINELSKILNLFPGDVEVMEILSELYLLNDEKDKAFKMFKKLAVIAPNNGRIHLTLANYYRENGENELSYAELKLAFKSTELNIDTKVRILISYYQLIQLNEEMQNQTYELVEILIKTHPQDLKARAVFADILYTNNEYEKAKEQYLIILKTDKSKSQIWSQVLFIQAEQNDFGAMLKTSKDALEYFPSDPLFYYFNGISNKSVKNYESAIESLEIGVDFIVDNEDLLLEFYSSLADLFHLVNEHTTSDEYYEKGLEIDSNNVLILNNYAYYLSLRKIKLDYAKTLSFRCNEIQPENGTYQDTYAWILYKLTKYEEAKKMAIKSAFKRKRKKPSSCRALW
jgi:tetratricopeptide (TPR) repeat protein